MQFPERVITFAQENLQKEGIAPLDLVTDEWLPIARDDPNAVLDQPWVEEMSILLAVGSLMSQNNMRVVFRERKPHEFSRAARVGFFKNFGWQTPGHLVFESFQKVCEPSCPAPSGIVSNLRCGYLFLRENLSSMMSTPAGMWAFCRLSPPTFAERVGILQATREDASIILARHTSLLWRSDIWNASPAIRTQKIANLRPFSWEVDEISSTSESERRQQDGTALWKEVPPERQKQLLDLAELMQQDAAALVAACPGLATCGSAVVKEATAMATNSDELFKPRQLFFLVRDAENKSGEDR